MSYLKPIHCGLLHWSLQKVIQLFYHYNYTNQDGFVDVVDAVIPGEAPLLTYPGGAVTDIIIISLKKPLFIFL